MVNQEMLRLPCARCGRTVLVPKEEYEEDPQGLITCDECWALLQKEVAGDDPSEVSATTRSALDPTLM